MRTIGLIGGMSWESSAHYYAIINRAVRNRVGGNASARILLLSLDFAMIERLQHDADWDTLTCLMIDSARQLERGGADLLLICTNTMHRMADEVAASIAIPMIHIADPVAQGVRDAGYRRVGLLGTAFTMEGSFFVDRLAGFGLEAIVPDGSDRRIVHDIIYRELVAGQIRDQSRDAYRAVMARLVDRGAEAIILACTEIMLLVGEGDASVPLFDTTRLHALAAVDAAFAA